jgi:uncharacterized membrane protein
MSNEAKRVIAFVAPPVGLFVFGVAWGAEPWRMVGAIVTLFAVIGLVWLAGYRGGVR